MAWTLMFYIVALGSVLKLRQANAAPLLDCTSQIRLYFPHLFEHCNTVCQYSEWSDWQMVSGSTASVPTSQCPSGEAYTERRTRFSSEFNSYVQGCTNTTQSRQICMPDRSDIIIMSLGLGSSGNVFDSVPPPALTSTFNLRSKRSNHYCSSQRICHSYGKRSSNLVKPQEAVQYHTPKSSPSISTSKEAPLPFDWK